MVAGLLCHMKQSHILYLWIITTIQRNTPLFDRVEQSLEIYAALVPYFLSYLRKPVM